MFSTYATSEPAAEPRPAPTSCRSTATSAIAFIVRKYFEKPLSSITPTSYLRRSTYSWLPPSPRDRRPSTQRAAKVWPAVDPSGTTKLGKRTLLSGRKSSILSCAIWCVLLIELSTSSSSYFAPHSFEYFLYDSNIWSPFFG